MKNRHEIEQTTTYYLRNRLNALDWVEELRDVVAFDIGISL